MELTQYFRIGRKWLWLLLITTFAAASVSFVVSSRRDPVYEAEATLFVGGFIQDPNPGSGEISVGEQLAETYAALATTYTIAEASIESGELPLSPTQLRSNIRTRIEPATSLLIITASHSDPVVAADMANQVAEQLIVNSPSNLSDDEQSQLNLLNQQLGVVQAQLSDTQQELEDINTELETEDDIGTIVELNSRRDTLVERINVASSTVADLTISIQNIQRGTNRLEVVDPARIPSDPTGLDNLRSSLLAAAVGLAIGIGIVLLIEYLNDTFATAQEVTSTLGVPVLGTVFKFGKPGDPYPKRLVTHLHPTSPVAEGFRSLRTNLLYSYSENGLNNIYTVAITSPGPTEGKSITAANLAVTMANAGMRVLLIDSDLRRPKQHLIFDLENDVGLTTLLFSNPENISYREAGEKLDRCVQSTSISHLSVITSGFLPSNPSEILGSAALRLWHQRIVESNQIDVVIYDSPPALVVADSAILSATVDAKVILVFRAGQTRRSAAQRVKEQFENIELDIAGIALNGINPSDQGYGYSDTYYYYYTSQDGARQSPSGWRRITSLFNRRN